MDTSDITGIQNLFWDLHFLRKPSSEGGIEPFDPQRIKAHIELSGQAMNKWEYRLLLDMDLVFRSVVIKKRG